MRSRIAILAAFFAAAAYHYSFEFVRTIAYDRVLHVLNPYIDAVTAEFLLNWGVTALLAAFGVYLFWKTRPQTVGLNSSVRVEEPATDPDNANQTERLAT